MNELMKKCSCCGQEKPQGRFGVHSKKQDGTHVLSSHCKDCKAEQKRRARLGSQELRQKHAEVSRKYRLKNSEQINSRRRSANKNLTEDQLEKRRQYFRDYRAKNKDKIVDKRTAEQIRADSRRYYLQKSEIIKARVAKYQSENKDRARSWWNTRRTREQAGRLSGNIVEKLLSLQKWKCACCRKSLRDGYHLDHIVPLSKGGLNIDQNVQLLTPECNMRKSVKDPITYMQEKGFLL